MKNILLIIFAIIIFSCTSKKNEVINNQENSAASQSEIVADTIRYNVRIMALDETEADNLKRVHGRQLVDKLFESIYQHQAEVTDYTTGQSMSIDDVKTREIEDARYSRDLVSVLQFTEQWRYNATTHEFSKKVLSIHIAYAVFDENGEFFADRAGIIIKTH